MDVVSRLVKGALQIDEQPLSLTLYSVGVNLSTCVLQGKNADSQ
jgi:hypothetical protein